jgi:hypothetical protein
MSFKKRSSKRTFIAISMLVFTSCLAAASAGSAARACPGLAGPSKLDYLVLASIADSPQLLSMAGYRPSADQHGGL